MKGWRPSQAQAMSRANNRLAARSMPHAIDRAKYLTKREVQGPSAAAAHDETLRAISNHLVGVNETGRVWGF